MALLKPPAEHAGQDYADAAATAGFVAQFMPVLRTVLHVDKAVAACRALCKEQGVRCIAITSARAARALCGAVAVLQAEHDTPTLAWLAACTVHCVGKKTAASLRQPTWCAGVEVGGGSAGALCQELLETPPATGRLPGVVFLHGDKALPTLPEGLRSAGCAVHTAEVYTTEAVPTAELVATVASMHATAVCAFSPSGVEVWRDLAHGDPHLAAVPVVAIGPTTAAAVEAAQLPLLGTAARPTPAGVLGVLSRSAGAGSAPGAAVTGDTSCRAREAGGEGQ